MILALIIWYIPTILKVGYGSAALGSLSSLLTNGLLLLYYLLVKKGQPPWIFLIFGILFFSLSAFSFIPYYDWYIADFQKYLILLIAGAEVVRNTSLRELYFIFMIGASSILIHAAVFGDPNGRFSGFYLDPNAAGFICLIGCCLSYGFKNDKWRLLGLFFFTFCGLLTFSRTFMLLWFVANMITVFQDKKNINVMAMGVGVLLLIVSVSTIFQVNTKRLELIEGLLGNETITSYEANEDSRTDTWALWYDKILESPIIGNGYGYFTGGDGKPGVHNAYLRVIGEAGIFPFLIFVSIYLFMVKKSLSTFNEKVYQFLLALSLMALLLTTHNFISGNQFIPIVSLWLFYDLKKKKVIEEDEEIDIGGLETVN